MRKPRAPGSVPLRRADLIVTVSQPLLHGLTAEGIAGDRILVLPNGVDPDWFQEQALRSRVPEDIAGVRRPVIGYVGALSHWLDYDLVAFLAREMPEASVVMVGPPGAVGVPSTAPVVAFTDRPVGRVPDWIDHV